MTPDADGRKRVVIENVKPEINGGEFPIKRVAGEPVHVTAHIFSDGHDKISSILQYRQIGESEWIEKYMDPLYNDEWESEFGVEEVGQYEYTVSAWIDHFKTWQADIQKKFDDGQDVSVDLQIGEAYIRAAAKRASSTDAESLKRIADQMKKASSQADAVATAINDRTTHLMFQYPNRDLETQHSKILQVTVDRKKALFSAWYELFPRSTGKGTEHGTFKDTEKLLPEIADMGFNVLYLPPIHPIGEEKRKGLNNAVNADPGDPGSPWAIGSKHGGHKSIHPELGTMDDFTSLVQKARDMDIDIAMDIAFQAAPDHPWVEEHPEWFKWRPDGTVQFAENPPKRYEDILPINFESEDWKNLWDELKSVFEFWIDKGVKVFRVDNPHTKPFPFWQYVVQDLKRQNPELIFLAEAFTRPKIMYRLAKLGYNQSYTYFTWRNTKNEFIDYMNQLYRSEVREFFRPNFWPNTPDILPESLQYGGKPAFMSRAVLAATLSSNYGIYGPAYELCVNDAIEGKEEYLHSEKYEIKDWNRDEPGNIKGMLKQLNTIRQENPALQQNWNLQFYKVNNDHILCYGKFTDDLENMIFVAVSLDPYHTREGKVWLPLEDLNIPKDQAYMVHELFSDEKFIWQGEDNYIKLDPKETPAKVFSIRRRLRRENDFDYFM